MKVLITGAAGQVGRALQSSVPKGVAMTTVTHAELDIGDPDAVVACVAQLRPDVIINAAAYTAVDKAESDAQVARRVNAEAPANLARAALAGNARLIHFSTDFVFDGQSSHPYRPDDPTGPLGVYGTTKLAGEQAVRTILPHNSVVLRTAWVYDSIGKNFMRTMLRLMRERGSVRVVADQVGTPTAAFSIAALTWAIVVRPGSSGIHHWTDAGVASWYDFAVAIAEEAVAAGRLTTLAEVIPIATADYPTAARRPQYSVLDKSSAIATFGLEPAHWRQNLRRIIGEVPLG